jgi:hypothetical protein
MSEPREVATAVEEVIPGLFHWHVSDDRIGGFISAAHALRSGEGTVLIDPLPLVAEELAELGALSAIALTSGGHQRSAWRLRRELGAPVYAPALSRTLEEDPDVRYRDGDSLPGGLRAIFTPGAGTTQHTLLREGEPDIAFVSDLLVRERDRPLELISAEYAHDIAEARQSVEGLLALPFSVLCLAHGTPITDDPKAAIRAALAA